MKQSTLKLLTLIVMLVTVSPIFGYDFNVNNIYYNVCKDGDQSCVVVSGENIYQGDIVIPDNVSYNSTTYSVIGIGDNAFKDCFDLTSVQLPSTLTSIGRHAFENCGLLNTLSIPDQVNSVSQDAFNNTLIPSLYIGCALNKIGTKPFQTISEIHITSSLKKIGAWDFEYAENLETLYVSGSIQEIESNAFIFCSRLSNVHIESLADWCKIKFGNTNSNPATIAQGFYINGIWMTSIDIPNGVTEIGDYAFYKCWPLIEVRIPDSVTKIGDKAFYYCHGLEKIYLGKGIKTIGEQAFDSGYIREDRRDFFISDITAFCQIDAESGIFGFRGDELFYNGNLVRKIDLSDETGIRHIGKNIFKFYEKLLSFSMPNSVIDIGEGAFNCCHNLINIKLSQNIETLPISCFRMCDNLTSISFPDKLTTIKENCFENCSLLQSISLPSNMKEIGWSAFYGCENIADVFSYSREPYEAHFEEIIIQQATLYVPLGCKDRYLENPLWQGFLHIEEMDLGYVEDLEFNSKRELSRYNISGQNVNSDYEGPVIILYSNGEILKSIKKNKP